MEPGNGNEIQRTAGDSGKVLPAGTYWFVLADNQGDRQTVQIFNADRSKLYATEDTAATERLHSTNNVEIKLRNVHTSSRKLFCSGITRED